MIICVNFLRMLITLFFLFSNCSLHCFPSFSFFLSFLHWILIHLEFILVGYGSDFFCPKHLNNYPSIVYQYLFFPTDLKSFWSYALIFIPSLCIHCNYKVWYFRLYIFLSHGFGMVCHCFYISWLLVRLNR